MKIVVLAGGTSTERDVSLSTGSQIYRALKSNGHDVIMLDVYLGYEFLDEEKSLSLAQIFKLDKDWSEKYGNVSEINPDISAIKALRPDGDKNFFGPNVISLCQEADIVFFALHGENGENGKIQACFDLMGIKYTGNDYLSSALSMDKALSKDIFKCYGIPTPVGVTYTAKEYREAKKSELASPVGYPCIVKACCGGSSVGVKIANAQEEYEDALKEAFTYDEVAVIEQYIKGREFSCCVMKGKAYPIIEIAPKVGFYDYKNKYQAGATVETCPALLDEATTKAMQKTAEDAYRALRLTSYARFDFMMDASTGKFYCLEANTLPGMTPTSLVPQEAAVLGISFNQLCEIIIEGAL